jgi:tRNA(Ile)-lysidine synthase
LKTQNNRGSLSPDALKQILQPYLHAPRWWLGLSGGLDSCVLLQLLTDLGQGMQLPPLVAVHIDHQLSDFSAQWREHCEQLCDRLEVELICRQVTVTNSGSGPEAGARSARYAVFEELVGAGDVLLLAHHADDQIETFFLRLMRGAGTLGLSGMPAQRALGQGQLFRPLLEFPRAALEEYALQRQLKWVEDDSNQDPAMDRNHLRLNVLPSLEERWPGYRKSIGQAMRAVGAAETELSDQYQLLLATAAGECFGDSTLDLTSLQEMAPQAVARVLRLWLAELGYTAPGRFRLLEFVRQLFKVDKASRPSIELEAYSLRRYRNRVHCVPTPLPLARDLQCQLPAIDPVAVPGLGWVHMEPVQTAGVVIPASGSWRLAFRQGGERCQPQGRPHSQSLKKLLQEYEVPPWWRKRLPLLYDGEELIAVADLWVCEGYQGTPERPGFQLHWR